MWLKFSLNLMWYHMQNIWINFAVLIQRLPVSQCLSQNRKEEKNKMLALTRGFVFLGAATTSSLRDLVGVLPRRPVKSCLAVVGLPRSRQNSKMMQSMRRPWKSCQKQLATGQFQKMERWVLLHGRGWCHLSVGKASHCWCSEGRSLWDTWLSRCVLTIVHICQLHQWYLYNG